MKDFDADKGEPLLKDTEVAQQKPDNDSTPAEALQGPAHDAMQAAKYVETEAGQPEAIDKLDQV